MSKTTVRRALEPLVSAWAAANNVAIAWENVGFTPPESANWAQVTLIPAETVSGSLDSTEYKGLLHVNIFSPLGVGSGPAELLAESLVTAFKAGLNANNVRVPRPPSIGQSVIDPQDYFMVPVRIRYRLNK